MVLFQSTLPTRGSDGTSKSLKEIMGISIHAPHEGERHHRYRHGAVSPDISIHAPHEWERRRRNRTMCGAAQFQSTLPTRGSDAPLTAQILCVTYFNPRSPRGGATPLRCAYDCGRLISIHAPHEGERCSATIRTICPMRYFNPHSPRGGATKSCRAYGGQAADFNPRSPRGGATTGGFEKGVQQLGISIHAPHEGERLVVSLCHILRAIVISIHAPHEGERHQHREYRGRTCRDFNPRSPRGGATRRQQPPPRGFIISIHATHEGERRVVSAIIIACAMHFNPRSPRGGATTPDTGIKLDPTDFNPRSPRGGATMRSRRCSSGGTVFQSTLPTRGSDPQARFHLFPPLRISIHAPHEGERPSGRCLRMGRTGHFNPRSPRGGATLRVRVNAAQRPGISIHAPHEGERRVGASAPCGTGPYFNPRSPRGGATLT